MKSFLKYWLPVVLYAVLIFVISSIPRQKLPRHLMLPDYILHIIEYLPLGFLLCRAVKNTIENLSLRKIFIFSIVLVALYAISDEFHQMFVPGRYASLLDLFCDSIGATIGARISL